MGANKWRPSLGKRKSLKLGRISFTSTSATTVAGLVLPDCYVRISVETFVMVEGLRLHILGGIWVKNRIVMISLEFYVGLKHPFRPATVRQYRCSSITRELP